MADIEDEKGGKAYALYSSLRRFFEPLGSIGKSSRRRRKKSSSRKWKRF